MTGETGDTMSIMSMSTTSMSTIGDQYGETGIGDIGSIWRQWERLRDVIPSSSSVRSFSSPSKGWERLLEECHKCDRRADMLEF